MSAVGALAWLTTFGCGGGSAGGGSEVRPMTGPPPPDHACTGCVGAGAHAATPPPPPPPAVPPACLAACARAAECGIGSFATPEACQSSCTSAPAEPTPGHDFRAVFACLAAVGAADCDASRACQLRAISALPPPEVSPGATVDARALASPIRATLGWRLARAEADAVGSATYVLVLSLVDAQGAARHLRIGTASMPQSESIIVVEPAPSGPSAPLFEDHRFFAGAGDDYRIAPARGALVVSHRDASEGSASRRWMQTLRVELARGASVQAALGAP